MLRWLDTDQIQQSDYYLLCGGLRIKTISNYDNNGKKLNYTTYDYNNENGCTGVLLNNIETIDSLHCKYFKDKVYATSIPRNVRLSEAPSHGKPITAYDFSSRGSQAYIALADEVIRKNRTKGG